jgi:hypothetical protein
MAEAPEGGPEGTLVFSVGIGVQGRGFGERRRDGVRGILGQEPDNGARTGHREFPDARPPL